MQRLISRKTEPLDRMLTRVQTARDETQRIREFDYVIVNREGQLDACVEDCCRILDAERLRVRQPAAAAEVLAVIQPQPPVEAV